MGRYINMCYCLFQTNYTLMKFPVCKLQHVKWNEWGSPRFIYQQWFHVNRPLRNSSWPAWLRSARNTRVSYDFARFTEQFASDAHRPITGIPSHVRCSWPRRMEAVGALSEGVILRVPGNLSEYCLLLITSDFVERLRFDLVILMPTWRIFNWNYIWSISSS